MARGVAAGDQVRRNLVLAICCMSVFIVGVDITVVNVALPSIQHQFHTSVSGLQWTIDVYALVIASLLILSGSLADRFGRRRAFQVGLTLFTAGSLLCSLAPNLGLLVAFRAMQAAGGSLLNPVAMSIIVTVFPDRLGRARATGVWGSVAGLSMAAGPVIGGVLVSALGWRSIFWINVPVGVAAVILTQRYIPDSRATKIRPLDPPGEVLIAVMLASITGLLIEGPRRGWTSSLPMALAGAAVGSTVALIVVELRVRHPLVDVRLFRSGPLSGATVIGVTSPTVLGGFLFLNTLYLQDVRGDSALSAGIQTIPMAAMLAAFANVSGRLLARYGPRVPFVLGGPLLATGMLLFLRVTPHTSFSYLALIYLMLGAGNGLVTVPVTNMAVAGIPPEQAGVAGGLVSTCRQFGFAMGVAICGSIVPSTGGRSFLSDCRTAFIALAVGGVLILVVGFASTTKRAFETARHVAQSARSRAEGVETPPAALDPA